MKQHILTLAIILFGISAVQQGFANGESEMFRFEGRPNLDVLLQQNDFQDKSAGVIYRSPESAALAHSVIRILLNGMVSDQNLRLEMRYRDLRGQWSDWKTAETHFFSNGRFWARLDIVDRQAIAIQYRFLDLGISASLRLEIYAVEGLEAKTIAGQPERSSENQPENYQSMMDSVGPPLIITRGEWGANPPVGNYVPHSPYRLTQHHTAGRRVTTLAEGIAEMQFIQDFHQNGRGWQDIGYHFTVDDAGRIYQGVPTEYRGTHVGGNNTGNIGISYMGNLDIAGEHPTQAALDSLIEMWSFLAFDYGITPDSLFGHRDYNPTACPGSNLYSELVDLRTGVRRTLGFGAPFVDVPTPQPFSQEVSPNTIVGVLVRDAEEGVDPNSITMKINGTTVSPGIAGNGDVYQVIYQPPAPFPASQNVVVEVTAADLASPANTMSYTYRFTIAIAAVHLEYEGGSTMRNALLELQGNWTADQEDVTLTDLMNGQRLLANDVDGSHIARIYPQVAESGDYRVLIASNNRYLGQSARYLLSNEAGALHPAVPEYNDIYFRQWGALSPSPVYLAADSDTNGYIEIRGLPDIPTFLMLDAFRLEKVDRLDPPTAPTLKWVQLINPAGNEIEVGWYPSLEGDILGYRLYMSEDGRNWAAPLADESTLGAGETSYRFNYGGSSPSVYFRMTAVDTNMIENDNGQPEPLVSSFTDIYGVGLNQMAGILVVDNFDRQASWSNNWHPFVRSHGEAIAANGHGFDSCTETAVQNGDIQLNDYDIVIYLCGDDSRDDESIAAADQFRLLNYVESGGKVFISGSEIGYDFAATTATELQRYQYLFKATYAGDLAGSNRVIGENSTVFSGLDFLYGTVQSDDNYLEDFPDYILPDGGSGSALFYGNLRIAGIHYSGPYGSGNPDAQLVYLGFPFETVATAADRRELMERVLQYFGQPTAVAGGPGALPSGFTLSQNFPNPFNPTTDIKYQISDIRFVELAVYDVLGRKVKNLVKEKKQPGSYTVSWDGRNSDGVAVGTGVYFYRLTAGEFSITNKMMLLR